MSAQHCLSQHLAPSPKRGRSLQLGPPGTAILWRSFQHRAPRLFRSAWAKAARQDSGPWPSSPWPRQAGPTAPAAPQPAPSAPAHLPPHSAPNGTTAAAAAAHRAPRHQLKGLVGDDFRHPLDQQNTALLRALPGLEAIARNLMGPAAEQVLLLENIGTSIKVGADQLPSLNVLLTEAAHILQMEPPELYVRQNPIPNAYTLAVAGRKPFIVVHTALLELLNPAEVQAVIAHELAHLKCDHGVWLTAANVLAMGTVSLLPVVSGAVEEQLMRWLRAAELTCDRGALLVAQDERVVISALMKLAGGSPSIAHELSVDAFLRQARSYDEATSSPLGWWLRNAQTRSLSHPLPVLRAREIDRWAQSPQYRSLLARGGPAVPAAAGSLASRGTAS